MYKLTSGNAILDLSFGDGTSRYISIESSEYKEWLAQGNIPEPEFNEKELKEKEMVIQISEYQEYLNKTDFKMISDYEAKPNEDLEDIKAKRKIARDFIRSNR